MTAGGIELHGISKEFRNGTRALDDINLVLRPGEFVVLVGPSGCGKSTALRIVAGLEQPTSGSVHIAGRDVTRTASADRDVAMVFQNYALYPHLSVLSNLTFGLRSRGVGRAAANAKAREAAELLGLSHALDRRPKQLSGGQRQRVAMGRAIVREPAAFLMDEPLSNLDAQLRVEVRGQIVALQRQLGVTTLYVTHDQVEALTMGERIAVLNQGRLQQIGSPRDLFDRPANAMVARFIGVPPMNVIGARLRRERDVVRLDGHDQEVSGVLPAGIEDLPPAAGVGFRPIHASPCPAAEAPADGLRVTGTVDLVEDIGSELIVQLRLAAPALAFADDPSGISAARPASIRIVLAADDQVPQRGEQLTVHVDSRHVLLFAEETGERLTDGASLAHA